MARSRRPGLLDAAGALALLAAALGPAAAQGKGEVEVMHQWTSASEAYGLQALKDEVSKAGLVWKDSAVAGGGGANLTQALQARFTAGNPPAAVQAHGQFVQLYAAEGVLGDLSEVAEAERWDELVSPELQKYGKHNGAWVAAPINQRRENMLWINKRILDDYGGKPPATWDEFLEIGQRMQKDGVIPLALGGDDWQEGEIFTNILIGLNGVGFYKKAVMELDEAAIGGEQMVATFDMFRKVLALTDNARAGRDWALATGMVAQGKAAMQFQGDWANGEFAAAKLEPGKDYLCVSAPGHGHAYVFLTDFFAMFEQPNEEAVANQQVLARDTMSRSVQEELNIRAGSIPARLDVPRERFNACSKQAFADRDAAIADASLLPSFVENHALPRESRAVFMDAVTRFANDPSMTPQAAAESIVTGLQGL